MDNTVKKLIHMSKRMRLMSLKMALNSKQNGSHLGGGLSCIEILAVLFGQVARLNSTETNWEKRDRILMSKAHGVLAYYSALYETGYLSDEDINSFEKNGSRYVGHPIKDINKGIEYSGGSLGMALSVGSGMALSEKNKGSDNKVYVILGDGECQEGSVWEAVFFSVKYKLDNLIIVVDQNGIQSDGTTVEVAGFDDIAQKMKSFGCNVLETDGHDIEKLLGAFQKENYGAPKVIIAKTIKGKGVSFIENTYKWHHATLNKEQYEQAVKEIEEYYAGIES